MRPVERLHHERNVVARRPPKMIALMGTPSGSSANLQSAGLFVAGAVKREFGCAAFSVEPFFHGLPVPVGELVGRLAVLALPPDVAVLGGARRW